MARIYDIGPFRLDADVGALTRAGSPVMLGARAVGVLAVLVEHAHEFLSKDRLIGAAWPGVIVEESNLPVQVHAIRRVLAQAAGGEQWIETLPKRGYRFVGPVSATGDRARDLPHDRRSNLPEPLTSFVGRERDLADLKRLLPTRRLVTIVGAGGIGKTRLALQVGTEIIDAYRDGVWFADLAVLRDPALVPTSVAQALTVQERPGKPLSDVICAHIRKLQTLLIIDNCEHLIDACADLIDAMLQAAAQVTIIATAREPIRVRGEQVYPLQPLSLPGRDASVEATRHSEAVQLLVERIRRQLPDFELTAARAPAVAEVCIHLDGLPLALELAAARARSVSIEQINARLADRFRLLTGGARTALTRQQTLRATLDWSYDLLAEGERIVLQRLAVFPGSFNVDAASAVASDAKIDEFAVIDLLSQLVTRSLVVIEPRAAATRYRLLETTRAYALEKLAETEETADVTRRHARYFGELFERAPDDWLRMRDADWHETYLPELDHVRAALDWSLGCEGEEAMAVALAGASGPLWTTLSLYGEGARRMEAAAARIVPGIAEPHQARLWLWLGVLTRAGTPTRALAASEQAVKLYRQLDDPVQLAYSSVRLARNLAVAGQFEESAAVLAEALPRLENCGLPRLLALYHGSVASLKVFTGDPVAARLHFQQAMTLFREAGNEISALESISNLADVSWTLGDLAAAEASLREYVAMRGKPFVRRAGLGAALGNLAGVLTERGQLDQALDAAREGLPLIAEAGSAWAYMDHFALRAALAGKHENAAHLAGYADAMYASKQARRPPNELHARARLEEILKQHFDCTNLKKLLRAGGCMSEAGVCSMALEA